MAFRALLSLCALSAVACSDPWQTDVARGNVLASRGRPDEAALAYQAAARAAPGKARPRELLGNVLFDQQRYAAARAAYEDAVQVEPSAALEAQIGLARVLAEDGHLNEAMQALDRVLAEHKDNLFALLSRANLAMRRGAAHDSEQAIDDTAIAMEIDSQSPSVLYTRGSAFIAAKDFAHAEEAFLRLEQTRPGSPLSAYGRARLASARGDRPRVLSLLKDARDRATHLSPAAWRPDEVRADSAFRAFKNDPEFAQVVGS